MTTYRTLSVFIAAAVLTGCSQTDAPPEVASLPIRYSVISVSEMNSAEDLTALCKAEESMLRDHLQQLESFTGEPTIDEYLESANSLSVSLDNMDSAAQSLSSVHPDQSVREAGEACDQLLSRLSTDMSLSRPMYDATSNIDLSDADDTTRHSVAKALLSFRLSGVDKDEATRGRIRELNDELVAIGQDFGRNIRDDVRYLELNSVDDLAGLPDDYIAAHQPDENGVIKISTQYPDFYPFMSYAEGDELRRQMMTIYLNRGYPQNKAALESLLAGRFELAQLIGYDNYAQLVTADKMTGSPETVQEFLEQLRGFTAETQEREYEVLLKRLRQDQPDADRVERWQAGFISEKVRQEQFDVDSKEIRQYFSYNNTREGIFTMVQDLFQVRIEPWETDTWHEDVEAYALYDGDEAIGRFYLDMHPREGKYQHAAMFPFVNGIEGQQLPVAGLICNFPEGSDSMQHSQVVTFLHEFGHLIHWMFAGHNRYGNVSGINTEWDFVEAPSQMLQEWVWDYDTISEFAKNSDGEAIPEDLLERMTAARDFGLGMFTRRQLSYAAISLGLYNRDPAGLDLDQFNQDITRDFTMFEPVENTHFYAAFGHLDGYSAIYYTYQWSLAIATDMFTRFEESGLRNVEVARSYREKVLSPGGSKPASDLATDFLGREVSFKPYADRLSGSADDGPE
jgi:thimet oligopeptidase